VQRTQLAAANFGQLLRGLRLVELKVNLDKNCTKLEISLFEAECHP